MIRSNSKVIFTIQDLLFEPDTTFSAVSNTNSTSTIMMTNVCQMRQLQEIFRMRYDRVYFATGLSLVSVDSAGRTKSHVFKDWHSIEWNNMDENMLTSLIRARKMIIQLAIMLTTINRLSSPLSCDPQKWIGRSQFQNDRQMTLANAQKEK
jgi:hypothetical protein